MKPYDAEAGKKAAGYKAAFYVRDGLVLGLGTGSTVKYFIEKLSERIRKESLDVAGIPTSFATKKLCEELGIKTTTLKEHPEIDLDVDGADEVDPQFNLIKGGGGAHVREKIVASASKEFIVVVDKNKMVQRLGSFPVAVEVMPFAEGYAMKEIKSLGGLPKLREGFKSDNGNIIFDCRLNIVSPEKLEKQLNEIPGVVDNGIFARRRPDTVIVGDKEKTTVLERE